MDLGPCTHADAPGKGDAPHTGTTIVAVSYNGGVVLGADGRVSTGTYISNRASNKIQQLTDNVFLLRSGSAADTQAIGDYVRYFSDQLAAELGAAPSVATVAKLVATMNYQNKDMLMGALIVAGYDERGGGQVYGCPIGGSLVQEPWAIDGSGSTYIWAALDDGYKCACDGVVCVCLEQGRKSGNQVLCELAFEPKKSNTFLLNRPTNTRVSASIHTGRA
jgi:20S proteasome subunit beta 1